MAVGDISIHAPREGRDACFRRRKYRARDFNPRAPRGARPELVVREEADVKFQSTRPARGATRASPPIRAAREISIHAPREGRDIWENCYNPLFPDISIHAPREGRDFLFCRRTSSPGRTFQSTRPARGATLNGLAGRGRGRNFNPRAPRGARL